MNTASFVSDKTQFMLIDDEVKLLIRLASAGVECTTSSEDHKAVDALINKLKKL